MEWKEIKHIEHNNYELPGNWVKGEYFDAFNSLFRIENALRIFLYIILKENKNEKWLDLSMTSDDEQASTIGAIAKRRYKQDNNFAYLGYSVPTPLLYLTSGELIRIITDDSYWKYFNTYFPATKEIIKTKLDEVSNIRNALAHFRPIKKSDVDLLKTNAIHSLSRVQQLISNVVNNPDVVPTNTKEEWYENLNNLGNERVKIEFTQSKDQKWVKVILKFHYPIISIDSRYEWSHKHHVLNLKTIPILEQYDNLRTSIIYMSYSTPSMFVDISKPNYIKTIRFTFSRKTLQEKYEVIKTDLTDILRKINEEVEMISQDTLARGEFIESLVIPVPRQQATDGNQYYYPSTEVTKDKINDKNIPEFWGTFNSIGSDFISDSSRYPWMPIKISEDKSLPF